MPLPEDFFKTRLDTTTAHRGTRNIFPDFGEEDVAEKGSAYDAIGEALWSAGEHFVSGATLGLTEFAAPTKAWAEKTTAENVGAAVGEALGFFVPMGVLGKGVRGAFGLTKMGSKGIAKTAIKESVKHVGDKALQKGVERGLKKSIFNRENARLLSQYELGGETLQQVNKTLMKNTEAGLKNAMKNAGLKELDDQTMGQIMKSLQKGLLDGNHINSVSSWVHRYAGNKLGSGPFKDWMAKYLGEFAQDAVLLGTQGVLSNAIHAAARDDIQLNPGSALGHAVMLSVAFPAIRYFGSGGERRIGELWHIMRAKAAKTDLKKVTDPEDLRGIMQIWTGGRRGNLLKQKEYTAKSGNVYHIDDFSHLNMKTKEVFDDMLDVGTQIQKSITKLDGAWLFGKAYAADTFNLSTIGRMVAGTAVMNIEMFSDGGAMFKHLPTEELTTHMLIGALMSRGRGGWARDPKSRSADAKATELNDYFQLMHLMGIDHSAVSDYVKVKNYKDIVMNYHMALVHDDTAQKIEEVYKKYEKRLEDAPQTERGVNDIIEEWKLLRDSVGMMREGEGFGGFEYNRLNSKNRAAMKDELSSIMHGEKNLSELSYNSFMQEFTVNQAEGSKDLYISLFNRLGRPSSEGAEDNPLNMIIDNNGVIQHGGINWKHSSSEIAELHNLLRTLETRGLAVKLSGSEEFPVINFDENPAALRRLEKLTYEFKEELKLKGLGEGVNYDFHLGDQATNPFLRSWVEAANIKSQDRMGNISTRQNYDTMDKADRQFAEMIHSQLADETGAIIEPNRYKIIDKDGKEVDSDLVEKFYGITRAIYEGADNTSTRPRDRDWIDIPEELAKQIVNSYEGLGLSILPEDLSLDHNLAYIESKAYEKFDMRPESIRVMLALKDANLAIVDKKNGKLLINSEAAIEQIAQEQSLSSEVVNELKAAHREIIGEMPKNVLEEVGRLEILEAGKDVPEVGSLITIRQMLPKVYEKEIRSKVNEVLSNDALTIDVETSEKEVELLARNVTAFKYEEAYKNLENLSKLVPGFEGKFKEVYDLITTHEKENRALDLLTFEMSDGSGVVSKAIMNHVKAEQIQSTVIQRYLSDLIYRGKAHGSISEYNKIVNALNAKLGNVTEKVSLNELFEVYLKTNTYESLQKLMKGVTQLYGGRSEPNELSNQHIIDAMEQMLQNIAKAPTKSKITLGRKYGLLDRYGILNPTVIKYLREGNFKSIKEEYITADKMTKNVDEDLLALSEIVRNTRDQRIIRFTEIVSQDGTHSIVREVVMPWDNTEFNTPSNLVIDKLNELGIELIPISKSGIIDGRHRQDISVVANIKAKYENNSIKTIPDDKYLNDAIKKDIKLSPEDETIRRSNMPEGKMRYVEVSLGRPINFVENDRSLESLNNAFSEWYQTHRLRFEEGSVDRNNFERIFNPEKVKDPELKIRALYLASLNDVGFDASWKQEALEIMDGAGGHYEKNMKLLKYSKLAEGGAIKSLPDAKQIETYLNTLDLPSDRYESLFNIMEDLNSFNLEKKTGGIGIGIYSDEAADNPFMIRRRQLDQVNKIEDSILREHLRERYSNTDRFKLTMDESAIDGAIYIDRDLRNLFLSVLSSEGSTNGFKGSIAKSGSLDMINLYGKGLFIFDPSLQSSMESKGVRMVMGETASKNFMATNEKGKNIKGRVSKDSLLENDIAKLNSSNIIRTTLEGIGVRFAGHLSNNSPVPHPYTHYMPENMVIAVRDGWQMLDKKMQEIKGFSDAIKRSANEDLANAMSKMRAEQTTWMPEVDALSFAEAMLNLGFTTRNPIVREAVMKMWEEAALPTLIKPKNPKFMDPFIMPDLKSQNPISVDVFRSGDLKNPVGAIRIQMGEKLIGEDAKHVPVDSVNELVFSFRADNVDYIVKYNNKDNIFNFYNPAQEWLSSGEFVTNISSAKEGKTELKLSSKIPKEVQDVIQLIDKKIRSGETDKIGMPGVINSKTGVVSLDGVQRYLEYLKELPSSDVLGKQSAALSDHHIHLVTSTERNPRKGISDFIPVRIRYRSKTERDNGIGTMEGINSLDVRSNLQGDYDGDHARSTHSFPRVDGKELTWDFLKQSFLLSSNNEEYKVLDPGVRKANIWGISKDANGDWMHAGSNPNVDNIHKLKAGIINDQRSVGKIIGIQSGVEWASLGGLSIGGVSINDKLGFSVNNLANNGDLFRRFEKGNQSAVDFISALNKAMGQPYEYMFNAKGEPELKTRLMDIPENSVQMDVLFEVLDVMKGPASLFNQVFSEMGGKTPTAYDIHTQYTRMIKFFNNPDQYIFNRLMKKWQYADVNMTEKLNQLIPLFFADVEGKPPLARDMVTLRKLALSGKANPTGNVIKFTEKTLTKLMRKSNVGRMMDDVVSTEMFRTAEMDLAWADRKDIASMKGKSENFIDELSLLKVLGLSREEMISEHETVFEIGREKYLKNWEDSALLYDLLSSEEGFLTSKLEYQLGTRNANREVVLRLSDKIDSIKEAKNFIETIRTKQILDKIRDREVSGRIQKKYFKNNKKPSHFTNRENKAVVMYQIVGKPYDHEGKPNWKAIKYLETIRPGQRSKARHKGKLLILQNPIIAHRLSKESTLEGYTWHYVHNSLPQFTEDAAFNQYMGKSENLALDLVMLWDKALNKWKFNKAVMKEFTVAENQKTHLLNEYFNRIDYSRGEQRVAEEYLVQDFFGDPDKSLIYYKAKMLLRPNVIPRHVVKTGTIDGYELPFMQLNQRIFKEVFGWLNSNGHIDVASKLSKEYNDIKNYLTGHSNDLTFDLSPSPLYESQYNLDKIKGNNVLGSILKGIVPADLQVRLNMMGIHARKGEVVYKRDGEYQIREVRDMFKEWKENRIDKRKTCRPLF